MYWLGRWYDLVTSFAAVLYVGRYKVVEAKCTYLHVLIHSTANSAEDACSDSPATGERPGFNTDLHKTLRKTRSVQFQPHSERKRWAPSSFRSLDSLSCTPAHVGKLCFWKSPERGAGFSLEESRSDSLNKGWGDFTSGFDISKSTHFSFLGLSFITCKIRGIWLDCWRTLAVLASCAFMSVWRWRKRQQVFWGVSWLDGFGKAQTFAYIFAYLKQTTTKSLLKVYL